jgi:hypothetical protein
LSRQPVDRHSLVITEHWLHGVLIYSVFKEHQVLVAGAPGELAHLREACVVLIRLHVFAFSVFMVVQKLVQPHVVLQHFVFVQVSLKIQGLVVVNYVVF